MINLKEQINNKKQPTTDNLTIKNELINNSTINNEEPMDDELIMISNILKDSTMNN